MWTERTKRLNNHVTILGGSFSLFVINLPIETLEQGVFIVNFEQVDAGWAATFSDH